MFLVWLFGVVAPFLILLQCHKPKSRKLKSKRKVFDVPPHLQDTRRQSDIIGDKAPEVAEDKDKSSESTSGRRKSKIVKTVSTEKKTFLVDNRDGDFKIREVEDKKTHSTQEIGPSSQVDITLTPKKPLEDANPDVETLRPPPEITKVAQRDVGNGKADAEDPQYATLKIDEDWDSKRDNFPEFIDQVHKSGSGSEGSDDKILKEVKGDTLKSRRDKSQQQNRKKMLTSGTSEK
ncbi:unnamed protein product [Bursaphelenchus okinawaensis]|uniref:Uncharacterized protein n=1 Tax=Bursaphelenchus okinawaensis TaxID=465554 RepID=A0A811LPN4_9BILA|nr:unnamed protein product [Bursaphelenchus okinawaensis]CAG9127079.1 unnamed protein product [Bursaphelenchus okinawaensis]